MEGGAVQPHELIKGINFLLDQIKEANVLTEKFIVGAATKLATEVRDEMKKVSKFEDETRKALNDASKISTSQINQIMKDCLSEIEKVKRLIPSMPKMPDLSAYDEKLEQIRKSIPVIKEAMRETPVEIRDKLETLPKGEKLSQDAVEGLTEDIKEIREMKSEKSGFAVRPKQITVSSTAPFRPGVNDLWYDIS